MEITFLTYAFLLTVLLAIVATMGMRAVALRYHVVDVPDRQRKIHHNAMPLLGGVAIFVAFFIVLWMTRESILARGLAPLQLFGFAAGACVLLIGGILDDIFNLKPVRQLVFPLLAACVVIAGGVSIVKVTDPFGISPEGLWYFSAIAAVALTFVWVVGMTYTTKLLDGVDGLVSGLGFIAGMIIFLFTMTTQYYQPDVGLMALLFAGACLGFLLFNFYPASIFLGESGSLLVGYIIAVLAIISGAKIAIALLVMGIPILDVVWTIARRLLAGNNPFKASDKKHLHHRFLDRGFSQRQTVLIYYIFAIFFGTLALFLQSRGKVIAIGVLAISMVCIAFLSVWLPYIRPKRA